METLPPLQLLDPRYGEVIKKAARARATQLRAEAQNAFWDQVARALHRAWTAVLCSGRPRHARC